MSPRRLVVTGCGVRSALGGDLASHLAAVFGGDRSGVTAAPQALAELGCGRAARVTAFAPRELRTRMLRKLLPPAAAWAVVAAGEALEAAALTGWDGLRDTGLFAGSASVRFEPDSFLPALRESLDAGGRLSLERFASRGLYLVDPLFLVKALPNGGLGGIAIEHQVLGPNLNLTNGPAAGLQAVATAAAAIAQGEVEVALAGGFDSLLDLGSVAEHLLSHRLASDERPCRPFDPASGGTLLGEGAAFVVLEEREHARRRGARVLGEIVGCGQAGFPAATAGDPQPWQGLLRAVQLGLDRAGLPPRQLAAVFGDGLGIVAEDALELEVRRRLDPTGALPVTAATAVMGTTGAARGVFSLIHAVEALSRGRLPPPPGWQGLSGGEADPPDGRARPLDHLLVWTTDRGVKNAAVVLGRTHPETGYLVFTEDADALPRRTGR